MLDDFPLPPHYDVDECVAIAVDPATVYVYWEVRADTMAHLRARLPSGSQATVVLRIAVVEPSWSGPRSTFRDQDVGSLVGESFVTGLPSGAIIRAAVGIRGGTPPPGQARSLDAEFAVVAHSLGVETPPAGPVPLTGDDLVVFTPGGTVPAAAQECDSRASAVFRAVGRIRKDSASAWRQAQPVPQPVTKPAPAPAPVPVPVPVGGAPLGSSERLA
jgi:hypothetical protein